MAQDYIEAANRWLTGDFDPETKGKIIELRNNDPAGFEDAFYKNLEFGTGGLRGLMGVGTNRMNKYTVGMATQGLANYILKKCVGDDLRVCISYDSRNNSLPRTSSAQTGCTSSYSTTFALRQSSAIPSARWGLSQE